MIHDCIYQGSLEKQNQLDVYMSTERDLHYMQLAHIIVEAGKSKICHVDLENGDLREPVVQMKTEGHWLENSSCSGMPVFFVLPFMLTHTMNSSYEHLVWTSWKLHGLLWRSLNLCNFHFTKLYRLEQLKSLLKLKGREHRPTTWWEECQRICSLRFKHSVLHFTNLRIAVTTMLRRKGNLYYLPPFLFFYPLPPNMY